MDNNQILSSTLKIFQSGIEEIEMLKAEINSFNETIMLFSEMNSINKNDIKNINYELEDIKVKQKKFSNYYKDVLNELHINENEIIDKIKFEFEEISNQYEKVNLCANQLEERLNLICIDDFISKYKGHMEYAQNRIEYINRNLENLLSTSDKLENLEKTLEKLENLKINEKVDTISNKIKSLESAVINFNNEISDFEDIIKSEKIDEFIVDKSKKVINLSEKVIIMKKQTEKLGENINVVNDQLKHINDSQCEKVSENLNVIIKNTEATDTFVDEVKVNRNLINNILDRINYMEKNLNGAIIQDNKYQMKNSINSLECKNEKYDNKNADKLLERYIKAKDVKEALEIFKTQSKAGNMEADYKIGEIYYNGIGTNKNEELAIKFYEKAANRGSNASKNKLLNIYEGKANNGDVEYQNLLGNIYLKGELVLQNIDIALKYFELAAYNGDEKSQQVVINLHKALASKCKYESMYKLGEYYYNGIYVEEDLIEANKWYLNAEKYNYKNSTEMVAESAFEIGEFYSYENMQEALKWYELSAKKGDDRAQYKMGEFYYKGIIVPKNEEKANYYYKLSAEQGNTKAIAKIKIVQPVSKFIKEINRNI